MKIEDEIMGLICEKEGPQSEMVREKVRRFASLLEEAYEEEPVRNSDIYYDAGEHIAGHEVLTPFLGDGTGTAFLKALGNADGVSIRILPPDARRVRADHLLWVDLMICTGGESTSES